MKPDWSTAPDFANYLAKDRDGEWFWTEDRPVIKHTELEERPVETEEKANEV
jgi:hypothetical protein